ncbi:MAG: peptide chain release factor N(5)-glutamine methyltransferase, partial [Candidatus Omnitrophica bacterium]|nr:peptide chain release factor N(5)-glutamine methyltransferase [Candidatus Omnitrophota bacterium]
IPRPETEVLVETAIDIIQRTAGIAHRLRILDLCTGSGNIAIALTKDIHNCKIVASDISEAALAVAKKNAALNGVFDRIEFIESDLFENIKGGFDIIVSNPPYVARYEFAALQREVLMEPRISIDGGEDGLDFYRRIQENTSKFLKRDGYLIMETGFGQSNAIINIIEDSRILKVTDIVKDRNSIDRVMVARWIN